MSPLTFTYFDIRGIAEVSRFILAVAGEQYTDERYGIERFGVREGTKNTWAQDKQDTDKAPFGKLPTLTLEDGTVIPQSNAINRYLAKRFGLYGANDTQAALIDAATDKLVDARLDFRNATNAHESTQEGRIKAINEGIASAYRQLEAFGRKNGGGENGLIGNKLSLFDLSFFYFHSRFNDSEEDTKTADAVLEKEAPLLASINRTVGQHPEIKKWLETRPKTAV